MSDLWERHKVTASFVFLFAYVTIAGAYQLSRIESESTQRRDQNCTSFESAHKQEIDSLRFTYQFLDATPRAEWDSTQRFVFRFSLPQLEREAARDTDELGANVPAYCDQPGIGLKEPDPVVPKRPAGL